MVEMAACLYIRVYVSVYRHGVINEIGNICVCCVKKVLVVVHTYYCSNFPAMFYLSN